MGRIVLIGMLLVATMGAAPYSGRTTTSGNQSYYYGRSGQYQGRSSTVGNNTYYYGAGNKYQGRTYSSGKNTYSYGTTPYSASKK